MFPEFGTEVVRINYRAECEFSYILCLVNVPQTPVSTEEVDLSPFSSGIQQVT